MKWYNRISFFKDLEKFIRETGIKNIRNHIGPSYNSKTPTDIRDGITFIPENYQGLISQLEKGNAYDKLRGKAYEEDDPMCWAGKLALKDTKGRGYRSVSKPSVHFKISKGRCNIHLDLHPFVQRDGFDHAFYNPDFPKHTIDELLLPTLFKSYRINADIPYSGNRYDASKLGISAVLYERIKFDSRTKFKIGAFVSFKRQGIKPEYSGWGLGASLKREW